MIAVYAGNSDSQDLSVFALQGNGGLTPIETVPVQRPVHPGRSMLMAVSPDRRLLYAGFFTDDTHSAAATYDIDAATGRLTLRGKAQLADVMAHMSVDRSGRFLLSASYHGNKVAVNAIDADGVVAQILQVLPTEAKAHCILTDPLNRTVLHTALGGDVIRQDRFDPHTGRIGPLDPPAVRCNPKAGPRFMVFSRDGRFLYVIHELDATIGVYPFDPAGGVLQPPIQAVTVLPPGFTGRPWAADIHLSPDGRFLYGCERSSDSIAAFRVDPRAGMLTPIDSFATVRQPRAFAIDPSGRHLLASGQLSNSIVSYSIDAQSGRLQAIGEFAVGRNPTWVEIVQLP